MILIVFSSDSGYLQLGIVLAVPFFNLLYLFYLKPYKMFAYMSLKILAECSIFAIYIILIISSNQISNAIN